MAKIDDVLSSLENGLKNPVVSCGTSWIDNKDMEKVQVRRNSKGTLRVNTSGVEQYKLWFVSVGEHEQPPAVYWGHKMSDALKKALAAKGLPTVNKRAKN